MAGSERLEAIGHLIQFYRNKHNEQFLFSDKVSFRYDNERGVHLIALEPIQEGEVLIKLPKEESISYSTISDSPIPVGK